MGEGNAKIQAKLVLDDQATKSLIDFKNELDRVANSEKKVAEEGKAIGEKGIGASLKGIAGKGATLAAGAGLAVGLAAAAGFAKAREEATLLYDEVAAITTESDEQIRSLAGVLTMLDDQGIAYDRIYDFAGDLKNELEDVGIEAGVSADAVTQAFEDIYQRGGKTVDQAMALTESMTEAARVVPGGLSAISAGFSGIEMGVIRARNPLVQMISAMGILHGNAKQVASQMQKMTSEQQIALAEQALEKMGAKAGAMPLSFQQVTQSIRDIKDNFAEALGTPVLAELTTQLNRFQAWLVQHRDVIEQYLTDFGEDISDFVDFVSEGINALDDIGIENSDDLRAIWRDLTETFRSEWSTIMDNQGDIRDAMKEVIGDLIHATRVFLDLLHEMNQIGETIRGALREAPVQVLAEKGASMEQGAIRERLKSAAAGGAEGISDSEMQRLRKKYIEDAQTLGQDAAQANADFTAAYADHAKVVQDVTRAHNAAIEGNAQSFGDAFSWAAAEHNKAAQENIAQFVGSNANIQQALLQGGPDLIKSGAKGFIDALKDTGQFEFADRLKKAWAPKLGDSPSAVTVNFNNAQISIKQDFRDQDPERVIVQFKKGLGNEAANRAQSRLAAPFQF